MRELMISKGRMRAGLDYAAGKTKAYSFSGRHRVKPPCLHPHEHHRATSRHLESITPFQASEGSFLHVEYDMVNESGCKGSQTSHSTFKATFVN